MTQPMHDLYAMILSLLLFLCFKKNLIFLYFYFKLINFFIFKLFWYANVKNNFLKIKKKYYFNAFPIKKQLQPHYQTYSKLDKSIQYPL